MRQRKVKNEEEKIEAFGAYVIKNAEMHKGHWRELFGNDNPIYIEIGCGKGQFITTLARINPNGNYIAVEGAGSVILRALEKASAADLKNIKFITKYVNEMTDFFVEGEIDGIYLNFSDPWPKDRHAKRRLTHTRYIKGYKTVLKQGGHIEFKTDNDGLFTFSVEEFLKNDMQLVECTDDLHKTNFKSKQFTTEYEDKFNKIGKNIHYLRAK
ncbi:MAG: tRNA (guanosine(46)-N7)-methyltransferase TrmB [Anaerovorax sp.]|nr:tRNA (guanosine(46)-N7)-methyltransferase TrmB [Anaerovorax sp.]